KVHELTDPLDDPFEKIDVLYRYMQDNTRYVSIQLGIGGFQTFEASYVFEKGYGDCKALSNYMKSMLKEIGIKSHHVIIGAGKDRPAVVTDFVSNQFNHMILCVPTEQDTVWLECTSNVNPTGYLGLFTENRHALVLTPDGGVLTSTPSSGPAENAQFRTAKVVLDDAGNAKVKTEIRGLGNAQGAFTEFAKNRTKEDQEKFLREYWIEASSFDLESYEFEVLPPSNPPEARLRYVLSARNWSSLSGSRLFLTPNVLENNLSLPPIVDDRTQPLCNYVPKLKQDTITYTLPEGYIVEAMDTDPTEINWKHGNYRSQIELVDPQTLRYTRSFMLERFNLPASEYNAYRKFIKSVIKADRQQIVLSSRS
ncbi:MAG: transglutaminase domain-containing protein, partial [Bacteroidota bacterium]